MSRLKAKQTLKTPPVDAQTDGNRKAGQKRKSFEKVEAKISPNKTLPRKKRSIPQKTAAAKAGKKDAFLNVVTSSSSDDSDNAISVGSNEWDVTKQHKMELFDQDEGSEVEEFADEFGSEDLEKDAEESDISSDENLDGSDNISSDGDEDGQSLDNEDIHSSGHMVSENIKIHVGEDDPLDPASIDVSAVQQRIQKLLGILADWKNQQGKEYDSRVTCIRQLHTDLAHYYGYSAFMLELLSHLFSPAELVDFLEANETLRPVTIRVNTLKIRRRELAQALIARGVNLDPIDKWSSVGLQIFDSPVPIGATPEYLAGQYMIQAAASFLPVIALGASEGERILDMCAAPGGKTTYIAAMMKNTGILFANDASRDRCRALVGNIHRLGIQNTVVTCLDGRKLPTLIRGFNRILLDAPCSGTGVISKDPSVKLSKTEEDFKVLTHLQKELILAAIDSLDAIDSVLVYSTCSITVEENEQVVQYALEKRPNMKLVDTGLEFGRDGFTSFCGRHFHPSLKLTKRFYPHVHNLDGFYVAKLVKTAVNKNKPTTNAKDL